jgi:hypothetical protein
MENGIAQCFRALSHFPFTIYHLPFSIQAGIFQRPANALPLNRERRYDGSLKPVAHSPLVGCGG